MSTTRKRLNTFTEEELQDEFSQLSLSTKEDRQKVLISHVIFRNGETNIQQTYNGLSHVGEEGLGQLTKSGKQNMFKLGKFLTERYGGIGGIVKRPCKPNNIYIQSSDFDRTIMSAQCLAAGMFRPMEKTYEIWNKEINWQPIPIHTIPFDLDETIAVTKKCEQRNEVMEGLLSIELKKIKEKFADLFNYWSSQTGRDIEPEDIQGLLDTVKIQKKQVPDRDYDSEWKISDMEKVADSVRATKTSRQFAKLQSGLLFKEIIQRCEDKIKGKTDHSLYLYSAHGSTISNLLSSMGLSEAGRSIEYGDSLHVELAENISSGFHMITVILKKLNSPVVVPFQFNINGSRSCVPIYAFKHHFQHIIPGYSGEF